MSQKREGLIKNFKEAWFFRVQGEHQKAIKIVEESLSIAEKEGFKEVEAKFLALKGRILRDQQQLQAAYFFYERAALIYGKLYMDLQQANALRQAADIAQMQGEYSLSEEIFNHIFELLNRNTFEDLERANTFRVYAILKEAVNDMGNAILFWKKAKELYNICKIEEGVKECESHILLLSEQS